MAGANAGRRASSMRWCCLPSLPRLSPWRRSGAWEAKAACSSVPSAHPRMLPMGRWPARRISGCTERRGQCRVRTSPCAQHGHCCAAFGQATVEAAVLLPTLMLLMALLMQPACLLYTRAIMRAAAGECARVLATGYGEYAEADCRAFALRRLAAVPELSIFHVGGGEDWDVTFERGEGLVTVRIAGHLRPLPLLGMTAELLGSRDAVGTRLDVEVSERVRADWVEGDYESWVQMWE